MGDVPRWQWRDRCSLRMSLHGADSMRRLGLRRRDILEMLAAAREIEAYPARGYRYVNFLLLGDLRGRPIHLLLADSPEENAVILVTVYFPDPGRWLDDWCTRRRR